MDLDGGDADVAILCGSDCCGGTRDCDVAMVVGELISATDRHRQSTDHPIKFILRRQPNSLKFKIKPGPISIEPRLG
ncbi:hypothetical protein RJ639_005555 [Escallonia herrerae]|uniref:Uncharacterized protein n=1 Tax=Escallonia herrerae TaxID=1293975 RepID=A0AA89AWU0_9ASTE|nr:hypothetical protein RJ639_005555 [Escallonia herrerae]